MVAKSISHNLGNPTNDSPVNANKRTMVPTMAFKVVTLKPWETIVRWYLQVNPQKPGFLRWCELDFVSIHSTGQGIFRDSWIQSENRPPLLAQTSGFPTLCPEVTRTKTPSLDLRKAPEGLRRKIVLFGDSALFGDRLFISTSWKPKPVIARVTPVSSPCRCTWCSSSRPKRPDGSFP